MLLSSGCLKNNPSIRSDNMPKRFFTRTMTACMALVFIAPNSARADMAYAPFVDYPAPDGKHRIHTVHHGGKAPIIAQFQKITIFDRWKDISSFSLAQSPL